MRDGDEEHKQIEQINNISVLWRNMIIFDSDVDFW